MISRIFPYSSFPFHSILSLSLRLDWLINLRWIAALIILTSVPVAKYIFGLEIIYQNIFLPVFFLFLINMIYTFLLRYSSFQSELQVFLFAEVQIICDLLIISEIIHFTGGIYNPFFFLYLMPVIISGILFPGYILPFINASAASLLLVLWTILEYTALVPTYILTGEVMTIQGIAIAIAAFLIINYAGIYIIFHFMRNYRLLKNDIDQKNRLLEKSMNEQNRIFRYAAHELKSPLTVIKSTLEVVKDMYLDDLPEDAQNMVVRAERRSGQVLAMVKEMIDITQYNLNTREPKFSVAEFNSWILKIVEQQRNYAVKKNISLEVKTFYQSIYVEIDKAGIEKVIRNLVNNALRYTPEGGKVDVEIFMTAGQYGLKVMDTGIGIEPEDVEKIFQEFYRGKEAKKMERIGTGLGLNLVKEIVESNNGKISVTSKPGSGSKFTVQFPIKNRHLQKAPSPDVPVNPNLEN